MPRDSRREQAARGAVGIPVTSEMLAEEQAALQEAFALLGSRMAASGVFVPEKLPALLSLLREVSQPFARIDTSIAFKGETVLTAAEKKALGLNPRLKYTTEYLAFLRPEKLPGLEPKGFLANMQLAAFNEVRNRRELAKLRLSGLVQRVGVRKCEDRRDCEAVRNLRKTFAVGEAPALPLPGCDAPYCRCSYMPIL